MASKVMCTLTWDDPSLSEYCTTSAWGLLRQMSPAGPITNVLTPLWHLPLLLNPWKRAEQKRHDEQQGWWLDRYRETRCRNSRGEQRWCWTKQFIDKMAHKSCFAGGDEEASSVLGMMALVGVFTVAGPLSYWLVAMVNHPGWQAKVQEEVDRECAGRLPTLDDAPRLPVLRACIKETMRWRPNVPTGEPRLPSLGLTVWTEADWRDAGVAHESEVDDNYKGFFIEKGTRLLPLDWQVSARTSEMTARTNTQQGFPPQPRQVPRPGKLPARTLARARLADLPGAAVAVPHHQGHVVVWLGPATVSRHVRHPGRAARRV